MRHFDVKNSFFWACAVYVLCPHATFLGAEHVSPPPPEFSVDAGDVVTVG